MFWSWVITDVAIRDNKAYYRSINGFTNRVRVVTAQSMDSRMGQHLDVCILSEALSRWNSKVDKIIRVGIMLVESIEITLEAPMSVITKTNFAYNGPVDYNSEISTLIVLATASKSAHVHNSDSILPPDSYRDVDNQHGL
jgi:hypothetical protein